MKKLMKKIAQLFIFGFPGSTPPPAFLNFIGEEQPGGIILFEDNCGTYGHTRENVEKLRNCFKGSPPFIAVDQEGGRVCRLRGMPAEFKAASYYAENRDVEHYIEDYSRAAVYMESLGINLNLAPVADICFERVNPALESRCFGEDPETVSMFVEASIRVSKAKGLLSCVKHFPGLGAAAHDPHKKNALAMYDEIVWQQREMIPFRTAVENGVDIVMTTHMHAPKLDNKIVTGSEKIISGLLRKSLAFDGPIVTDDLLMGGASPLGDIGERTVAAFNAGHDLLLFGRNFDEACRAYEYFINACERGEIPREKIDAALDRVMGIKFKLKASVMH